jgi:large subunit ribosomal protein L15
MTMKNLGNLKPAKGSNKSKKRLGRGIGSGLGKTAGKGHKGQLARKGGKVRPGFEGGQMPMYRRLPKRGFFNLFSIEYNEINIGALHSFSAGDTVSPETLQKKGLIRSIKKPVKLLGNGELKHKLTIRVHKASSGAKAAIEKIGGTIDFIAAEKKPVVKNVKTKSKSN